MTDSPIHDQIKAGVEYMFQRYGSNPGKWPTGDWYSAAATVPDTLADAGHPVPKMPMGQGCALHVHREWVPLERHHCWPLGMGGPDEPANIVTVCANGHYSTHEFIRQLINHGGKVPAEMAVHFGAKVKRLAIKGWTLAGKPTKGSGGE